MKVAIASDHAGYALKEELIPFLKGLGHEALDLGTGGTASVDYPDYGALCAETVARGEAERGIVICGTGIGISIAANKIRGARCALCTDPVMARLSRQHNDANMLALGARIIGPELARGIAEAFLSCGYLGGRHQRRVDKLAALDKKR